jgi:hypothetical protein
VIESLLRHDGFEAQERTVQLRPPYWPAGTEQHFWYRSSNWTHASLISLPGKKRVQFVFQAPQKGEPNVDKGDGVDSGGH